jgi:hypothetical protein
MHNHSKWGFCGEMMVSPQGDVFVLPQGDVLVSLRKCLCFPKEMCLFPQGNYGVSPGRCVCFFKEMMVSLWHDVVVFLGQ